MSFSSSGERTPWRIFLLFLLIVTGLAVLLIGMAFRQLVQGEDWTSQMAQSSTRVMRLPAPRGRILDRNGVVLVDNRPSYNVALLLDEFGAGRNRERLLRRVRASVEVLHKRMKMPVNVNDRVVRIHYDRRGPLPLTVWNDLSPAAFAAFLERSPWTPGVDLQIEPVRVYPYGPLACHVLGYLGKPEGRAAAEEDYDTIGRRAFSQPVAIGKAGIEETMDKVLQGTPGQRVVRLDAAGFTEAEVSRVEPTPGNDVVLSLDAEIQAIVEESFVGYRGACVILDPRNGDVLALASMPSYNPNLFVPAIRRADWNALASDPQRPMLNRATQAYYSPGSTFKVIGALAGLETGLITEKTVFQCPGSFSLGNITFACWEKGGHGDMNLREALTMSCNVFFYNLGFRIGGPPLWAMSHAFGLGEKTGVPLDGESGGLLPTEELKRARNPRDRWTPGDSVNMSIGQGLLNVTPLQMAVVAAAFGNQGTVFRPRLVLRVETPNGNEVVKFPSEFRNRLPASPEHIQFIREAMLNVVADGTGKRAALPKIKIAAKTGSAQFHVRDRLTGETLQKTRAWMISFAPWPEPRYAMALVAEEGISGGTTIGPFTQEIYKKIFEIEQGRRMLVRPPSVAAMPVSDRLTGKEGEASGEILSDTPPSALPAAPVDEASDEAAPASFPAEPVGGRR
ncbi:MAG: penicillin-binding protein 2 [Verrucomicrobiae bacterium]|nr:penicillin-binding protein 2 [Verrucomicrobiae bacterium]